jgi:hypothetical protein
MSWRHKWQNFGKRNWDDIRASWLANVPTFPSIGSLPEPGLEDLPTLLAVILPEGHARFADVTGLRSNSLWEAVFLFHKCAHTHLASQRLGNKGMHSWSLFNAYHSAYLGARGMMTLLGVPMPALSGKQIAIDLFPEPLKIPKKKGASAAPSFQDFLIVRLPMLEQRYLWEAFQRVLRMTDATCWDSALRDDLLDLSFDAISPPRNRYLYKARFWPLSDLIKDAPAADFNKLFGSNLDVSDDGFLLRLCFSVYRLFEQLMGNLASDSNVIKEQFDGSRICLNAGLPEIDSYSNFISQISNT